MWKMLKKFKIIALYFDALIGKYKSSYEISKCLGQNILKRIIEISKITYISIS